MAYSDDLVKLRKRMLDALNFGVVDESLKDFYEATLIQIMNESERQRQACVTRAEELRRQAAVADGQANAFIQVNSIVYNVLNSYILAAEKSKREELERAEELKEKQKLLESMQQAQEAEAVKVEDTKTEDAVKVETTSSKKKKK